MRVTSRRKAIAFFITLSSCVLAVAVTLNVSWIVLHWRQLGTLVLGVIFFGIVIAGLVLNTIFLIRSTTQRKTGQLSPCRHSRAENPIDFDPPLPANAAEPQSGRRAAERILSRDA